MLTQVHVHHTLFIAVKAMTFTVFTVVFIGVVSAVIVTVTHELVWDTESIVFTLELIGGARCITNKHDIQITFKRVTRNTFYGTTYLCHWQTYCVLRLTLVS